MNNTFNVYSLGMSLLIIPFLIQNICKLFEKKLDRLQLILFSIFFLTHPIFIEVLFLNKFFTGFLPLLITIYSLNLRRDNSLLYGQMGLFFAATLNPAYFLPAWCLFGKDFKQLKNAKFYLAASFSVLMFFYFNQLNSFSHNILFAIGNFLNAFYFAFSHTITNISLYRPISIFIWVSLLFLGFSLFHIFKKRLYDELYFFLIFPFASVFFYSIVYPYDIWNEAFSNNQNYLMVLVLLVYLFIKTMPRLIIYALMVLNLYGTFNLVSNWFPISNQLEQDLATLELQDSTKTLLKRTLSWQYFFEGNKEKALEINQMLIDEKNTDSDLLRENIIFKK